MILADLDLKDLFESQQALALFLAFFIPGFIAKTIYGLFVAEVEQNFTEQLPEVIAYSAIHYAVFGLLLLPTAPSWSVWTVNHSAITFIVVLVVPIFEGPVILLLRDWHTYHSRILTWHFLRYMRRPEPPQPPPDPWNTFWVRELSDARYLRIRLKTREWVGGILGAGSFVSANFEDEGLYISSQFIFDEDGSVVSKERNDTGILVRGSEILYIEVLRLE